MNLLKRLFQRNPETYIQRYVANNRQLDPFGDYEIEETWDYRWLLGNNKVGLVGKPSSEADATMNGILVKNLIFSIDREYPKIDGRVGSALLRGDPEKVEGISQLIEMIEKHPIVHMHLASYDKPAYSREAVTFSFTPPPEELYTMGKIIPVVPHTENIHKKYKRIRRAEKMIRA
jgi:hypothetical protein